MTEKQFQTQIVMVAKANGWTVYHTYDSRRSEPGFPDLVLVRDRVLFRELKTDAGRMSKAQEAWGQKLTEAGADFKVWRPKDTPEIIKELMKHEKVDTSNLNSKNAQAQATQGNTPEDTQGDKRRT